MIYDIFETRVGPAVPPQLHPRRRADVRRRRRRGSRRSATFVEDFPKAHADMVRLLNRNRIFVDRTQGHRRADEGGRDQPAAAPARSPGPAAWSATCARTSRTSPTRTSIFKVVCATGGDCFARYLVRMDEMLESLKIIEQAVENLPAGPVNVDVERQGGRSRTRRRSIAASRG